MKRAVFLFVFLFTHQTCIGQSSSNAVGALLSILLDASNKDPIPLGSVFEDSVSTNTASSLKSEFKRLSLDINKNPKDGSLYYQRGLVKVESGAYLGAIDDFLKARELKCSETDLPLLLGQTSVYTGNRGNAIIYFKNMIRKDSLNSEAFLWKAIAMLYLPKNRFHTLKERCAEALPVFDTALKLRPDYKEALIERGFCYKILNRNADAITDLSKVTVISPSSTVPYILLYKIFDGDNNYKSACEVLEKAASNGVTIPKKHFKKCS